MKKRGSKINGLRDFFKAVFPIMTHMGQLTALLRRRGVWEAAAIFFIGWAAFAFANGAYFVGAVCAQATLAAVFGRGRV